MAFGGVPPIGQKHENSCWAACLTWWLKAMQGGRPSWTQQQVMDEYIRNTDQSTGAMLPRDMLNAWSGDTRLKMETDYWKTAKISHLMLGSDPVCVAFQHESGFAHMNVVWRVDHTNNIEVMAMEPYFPFPGVNGKRTGQVVRRPQKHYLQGTDVVMGWPKLPNGAPSTRPDYAE